MDTYSGRQRFLIILFLLFGLCLQAQPPHGQPKQKKRTSREIADSLYMVHQAKIQSSKPIDTAKVEASKNKVARQFISGNNDIPSSTLYQSTWFNEKVKIPGFSINQIPDEVILRLINEDKGQNFCFPIKKRKSSSYGWRWGRPHSGIDIALNTGDTIFAAFDGVVRLAKTNGGYGKCVVIRHYNNLETLYGHLSKINVKVGEKVKAGEAIGLGGSTGRSTGPHLHFECRLLYACFDPEWIFDLETYSIKTSFVRIDKSYFGVESSEKKANKKAAKSRLSKVDECFEGKPYVKTSTLIAEERKLIKAGKIPQYQKHRQSSQNSNHRYVIAKKGEKVSEIAKRFNISERTFRELNPKITESILKEQTKIRIK